MVDNILVNHERDADLGGRPSTPAQSVGLADLGGQLRRRWRVIALTVAACALLALIVDLVRAPSYSATAVVTVNPVSTNPQRSSGAKDEVNMTTERAVILSTEVIDRARVLMGSTGEPQELVDLLSVTSPPESQVLEVAASGDSPEASGALANAVARAYLDVRTAGAAAAVDRIKENLTGRIGELTTELSASPTGPGADGLREEIRGLRAQQSDLELVAVEPGRIITVAAPGEPSAPGALVFAAAGAVGGLLIGVVLALVRERTDGRVCGRARLEHLLSVPVLEPVDTQPNSAFLDRIALRLGLQGDSGVVTVALLGADQASIRTLGAAFGTHLRNYDTHSQSVVWNGSTRAEDGEQDLHRLLDPATWEGRAKAVLVSPRDDVSVARAALLGRGADKVIVAATPESRMAEMSRLIDELRVAGARIDLVVVVPTHWIQPTTMLQPQPQPQPPSHSPGPGQATVDIDVNRLRGHAAQTQPPAQNQQPQATPPQQLTRPTTFD